MTKTVAVAVIHGMGIQTRDPYLPTHVPTFSTDLYARVEAELTGAGMRTVAWREIFWQDILQRRQDRYYDRLQHSGLVTVLRKFVMTRLSDAASYRLPSNPSDEVYTEIHGRVRSVLEELREDVAGDAPLVLVAHSLGAHILSNFIYDAIEKPPYVNGFVGFETLSSFITFGTNIPVFLMSIAEDDLCPMAPKVARDWQTGDPAWWLNHYDLHDPLAYPLEMLGGKYAQMVKDGAMAERTVRSGPQIPSRGGSRTSVRGCG
ncbi:MAG: hypothetical protein AAGD92_16765 [Pseudomonadota bacterium]